MSVTHSRGTHAIFQLHKRLDHSAIILQYKECSNTVSFTAKGLLPAFLYDSPTPQNSLFEFQISLVYQHVLQG